MAPERRWRLGYVSLCTVIIMRIPDKVTTGGYAKASQFNSLVDSLNELSEGLGLRDPEGNDNTETPHAFWADIYYDSGAAGYKAKFIPGFVYDRSEGSMFSLFDNLADQTRVVADGDIFYAEITLSSGEVSSVDFVKETTPTDTEYIKYIKCVEFVESTGGLNPIYYRFDSIDYVAASSASTHPWKVTANGDDTVTIADGRVMTMIVKGSAETDGNGDYIEKWFSPYVVHYLTYSSGDVTVPADGYIYGKVGASSLTVSDAGELPSLTEGIHMDIYNPVGSITVYHSTDSPALLSPSDDYIHFLIAVVGLAGGEASVVSQEMFDNFNPQIHKPHIYSAQ
jgi:hypothetical protein